MSCSIVLSHARQSTQAAEVFADAVHKDAFKDASWHLLNAAMTPLVIVDGEIFRNKLRSLTCTMLSRTPSPPAYQLNDEKV